MNQTVNVVLPEGYGQVCVWPGTLLTIEEISEFEQFFLEGMGTRVKFLESITTGPDSTGPGGRIDLFFAVHDDDVMEFAVPRLSLGIRWIEDVLANQEYREGNLSIYPARVKEYCSWGEHDE